MVATAEPHTRQEQRARELAETVDEAIASLAEQLAQGHTDEYRRLLDWYSRFHRYSVANALLIANQCPEASRVASYGRWKKLGRQVAQGQTAIWIWCPIVGKRADEEIGEEEARLKGFRPCAVFDASQLADIETNPLP